MKSLFQISLVVLVVVVTVIFLTFLLIGMVNVLGPREVADTWGITVYAGGLSARRFYFILLAAAFLIGGFYLYRRQRKIHR